MPSSPNRRSYEREEEDEMVSLEELMAQMGSSAYEASPRKSPSSKPRSRPNSSGGSKARPLPAPPIVGRRNSRSNSTSRLSRKSSSRSVASGTSSLQLAPPPLAGGWSGRNSGVLAASSPRTGELDDAEGGGKTPRPFSSESFSSQPGTPNGESSESSRRLYPRSPRHDRSTLDDYAFLHEPASEDERGGGGAVGRPGSSQSHNSSKQSIRSMKLREEIAQTAAALRMKSSKDGLRPSSLGPGSATSSRVSLLSRDSDGSSVGFVPPPMPSPSSTSAVTSATSSYLASQSIGRERERTDSESRSITSDSSSAPSPHTPGDHPPLVWPTSTSSSPVRGEQDPPRSAAASTYSMQTAGSIRDPKRLSERERGERESIRTRQKETKEWSQSCWMWYREKTPSSGGGMLSKTPLIRDVPAAMKRKMGKRDSHQLLSPDILPPFDDSKHGKGLKEKASRIGFTFGPSSASKEGGWKRVSGVLRDDGSFRVFSEEGVVLHSVHLPSVHRTEVRSVDQSLFGRPNVVVIQRRTSSPLMSPPAFSRTSSASSHPGSPSSSPNSRGPDESIYLCMPTLVAMQSWIVMAHCFARPEFISGSPALSNSSPRIGQRKNDSTSWSTDEDDDESNWEEVDQCRIYRSLYVSVNEGKGIGEAGTEIVRVGSRRSHEADGSMSGESMMSAGEISSPSKMGGVPHRLHRTDTAGSDSSGGIDTFCELLLDDEVVARTSVRKGTASPHYNEHFTFRDLPPVTSPLVIKIYQNHKTSRPTLIGSSTVRIADIRRAELLVDWWPIKPVSYDIRGRQTDTLGELSLSIKVDEEVVLPSGEYSSMLEYLNGDTDCQIAIALAQDSPSDLEEVAAILLRIYQAETLLIPRIMRLAELEIDGDIKSAAILFRGNSILTKSIELYLRMVGTEFLDVSIGEPIRKLVAAKVEIEIDPARMKHGVKEKELVSNIQELQEWTTHVWNAIYESREKCPNDLRVIFGHIQKIVADKYGEDQKKMRSTSVSAFIFLRFFVPAVLNPKLFNIVSSPPDLKSQRTLTLVAKTLQGLANFSTFGQKEPWMAPMNSFVQDNTNAFVDFINHISTPAPVAHYEWTSPHAAPYLAPYRLRNSLAQRIREGVPLLPHLLDLPRDLGLLASHVARATVERLRTRSGRNSTSSAVSMASRSTRSSRVDEFSERCIETHEEAQRRGGGLINPLQLPHKLQPRDRIKARSATTRAAAAAAGFDIAVPPATPSRKTTDESIDLHIRASQRQSQTSSPVTPPSARRHNRAFTVSGVPPRHASLPPSESPASPDDFNPHSEPPAHSPSASLFQHHNHPLGSQTEMDVSDSSDYTDAEGHHDVFSDTSRSPGEDELIDDCDDASPLQTAKNGPAESPLRQKPPSPIVFTSPFAKLPARGSSSGMDSAGPSSVAMSAQGSTSTQASDVSTSSTISIGAEVISAQVVRTGRLASRAPVYMSGVGDDGDGTKRKGLLARMSRKSSHKPST